MPAEAPIWRCDPYSVAAADRIAHAVGVSAAVAQILVRRGYDTPAAAERFLAGDERHDPSRFDGIEAACERVLEHVRRGSRIVVHGDYDVDGVCSTAVLLNTLRALGAQPDWHLPSRFDGGYGLSAQTVERLAAEGAGLLITADCGITSVAEVERALELGLDAIVTDHHRPAERLPPCPIVHPVVGGYPCEDLCAAGVAHKLSGALYAHAGEDPARADEDLDLVALATVADVVALRGENRRLVREGLVALARTRRPGLRALMRVASLDAGAVDEQTVAFRLAPRINAAGRLQRPDAALELVLTEDEDRAEAVADELDLLNRERRDTETRILFAAEAARAEHADDPVYVLAGEGWNPGVIGIVASRLVERHHRPCLLITLGPEGGRGSGRSIAPYDLLGGLSACAAHLGRFGGHRAAAGFDIDPAAVDGFRKAMVEHAAASLSPADLRPVERVDAVVPGTAVGLPLAEELAQLAPFGQGNPAPTLLLPAVRLEDVRPMGEERQHARFTAASGGGRARVVAFRTTAASLAAEPDALYDVAAQLELNEWNGAVEPRLVLRALCPAEAGACAIAGEEDGFWAAFRRGLEDEPRPATPAAAARRLRDRRGEGVAGVACELLASGDSVLLVCADASRRRAGIERAIGALGPALVSWEALAAEPQLALAYPHLVAIDPPTVSGGRELLERAPAPAGGGFAHLAWGAAETQFALAVARSELDLRGRLADLYRALSAVTGPLEGAELEALLRGPGAHGRSPAAAARLARVLLELGLVDLDWAGDDGPRCSLPVQGERTSLELSAAYRARLEDVGAVVRALEPADQRSAA